MADQLQHQIPGMPGVVKMTYKVSEAIAATGIGKTTLYALIRDGRLKTRKLGHRTLIERTELERVISSLPSGDPHE